MAAIDNWLDRTPRWIPEVRPGRVFGVVLGIVGWYAIATVFPQGLMPYPLEVLGITWDLVASGTAWEHLWATIYRTFWGFLGSMILGTGIGVIMGVNNYGQRLMIPYIVIGYSIPAIAWAAISTLVFGFSEMAPIFATVAVTFPYIAGNVWKGVENVDGDLIQMSKSFGVSKPRLLRRMLLPNTAPALLAAVRIGLATSWKIVTIAEMFASSRGVGYKIITAYEAVQFDEAWAWAVLFMIIILIVEYGAFKPLERRVFEYRQDADISIL